MHYPAPDAARARVVEASARHSGRAVPILRNGGKTISRFPIVISHGPLTDEDGRTIPARVLALDTHIAGCIARAIRENA